MASEAGKGRAGTLAQTCALRAGSLGPVRPTKKAGGWQEVPKLPNYGHSRKRTRVVFGGPGAQKLTCLPPVAGRPPGTFLRGTDLFVPESEIIAE